MRVETLYVKASFTFLEAQSCFDRDFGSCTPSRFNVEYEVQVKISKPIVQPKELWGKSHKNMY